MSGKVMIASFKSSSCCFRYNIIECHFQAYIHRCRHNAISPRNFSSSAASANEYLVNKLFILTELSFRTTHASERRPADEPALMNIHRVIGLYLSLTGC